MSCYKPGETTGYTHRRWGWMWGWRCGKSRQVQDICTVIVSRKCNTLLLGALPPLEFEKPKKYSL